MPCRPSRCRLAAVARRRRRPRSAPLAPTPASSARCLRWSPSLARRPWLLCLAGAAARRRPRRRRPAPALDPVTPGRGAGVGHARQRSRAARHRWRLGVVAGRRPARRGHRARSARLGARATASPASGSAPRRGSAGHRLPIGAGWQQRRIVGRLTVDDVGSSTPRSRRRPPPPTRVRRTLDRGATSPAARCDRSLLAGVVLGDDRDQPPELADDFRAAGLTHLLAVSGQNVAFVLALAGRPARGGSGCGRACAARSRCSARFAVVVRFEPSVLRAALHGRAGVRRRPPRPPGSRASRARPRRHRRSLLVDPLLVRSVGFGLSVGASAGILLLAPRDRRGPARAPPAGRGAWPSRWPPRRARCRCCCRCSAACPVATLPANLLAVPAAGPLMTWGLTGGVVAGVVGDGVRARRCCSCRRRAHVVARRSRRTWARAAARRARRAPQSSLPCRRRLASSPRSVRSPPARAPLACSVPSVAAVAMLVAPVTCRGRVRPRPSPIGPPAAPCSGIGGDDTVLVVDGRTRASARAGGAAARRRAVLSDARRPCPAADRGRPSTAAVAGPRRCPGALGLSPPRGRAAGLAHVPPSPASAIAVGGLLRGRVDGGRAAPGRFDAGPSGARPATMLARSGPTGSTSPIAPLVMGILNRTPDSFFDQGAYFDFDAFLRKADQLVADGADFLDVGGVKAGPGRGVDPRSASEELERVVPAVEALAARFDVPLSVDTWRASVATRLLRRGSRRRQRHLRLRRPRLPAGVRRGGRVGGRHPHPAPATRADPSPRYPTGSSRGPRLPGRPRPRRRGGRHPAERIMVDAGSRPRQDRAAVAAAAARQRPAGRARLPGVPVGVEQALPRLALCGTEVTDRRDATNAAHALGIAARVPDPAGPRRAGGPARGRGRWPRSWRPHESTGRAADVPFTSSAGDDPSLVRDAVVAARRRAGGRRRPRPDRRRASPATTTSSAAVVDAAQTPPFLTDRRVVVGRDAAPVQGRRAARRWSPTSPTRCPPRARARVGERARSRSACSTR